MIVTVNDVGDHVCRHGTAMDVHCCGCHSGFIFDRNHVCPEPGGSDGEEAKDAEGNDQEGTQDRAEDCPQRRCA